jgi:hypothetical protein
MLLILTLAAPFGLAAAADQKPKGSMVAEWDSESIQIDHVKAQNWVKRQRSAQSGRGQSEVTTETMIERLAAAAKRNNALLSQISEGFSGIERRMDSLEEDVALLNERVHSLQIVSFCSKKALKQIVVAPEIPSAKYSIVEEFLFGTYE